MNTRRQQGSAAELKARHMLEAKGFRLVQANYSCRWGEIDLIMRDGASLVFVEVRSRRSLRYGTPLESIVPAKQRRLFLTAQDYLLRHPHAGPLRFDVVGLLETADVSVCEHLVNALENSSF